MSLGSPGQRSGQESWLSGPARAGCCVASAGVPFVRVKWVVVFGWLMFHDMLGAFMALIFRFERCRWLTYDEMLGVKFILPLGNLG